MIKKNTCIKIIVCSLLLGVSSIAFEARANDINKLDIKRTNSNGSALNVTVYTTNPYDENVAVTQKGDNKYVILIPNISGANASNVDFSSLKDVVSDVNVKSVNDGAGGYTKVTLTTTKPVSISTSTRKSAPLTEEQKAYKNLIAQSRGYDTQTQRGETAKPRATAQTTTVSAPVAKNIQTPVISQTPIEEPGSKNEDTSAKPKTVINKIKSIVDSSANQTKKAEESVDNSKKVVNLPALDTSFKKETEKVKDTTLQDLKNDIISENKKPKEQAVVETPQVEETVNKTAEVFENVQNQINGEGFNKTMITTILLLIASLIGITALFRMVKKSLEHSVALRKSFKENLKESPHPKVADYSDIVEDASLNWQEKYQKFISTIEVINPEDGTVRHIGNGEYEYVTPQNTLSTKAIKSSSMPKLTAYNKPAVNSAPSIAPIQNGKNKSMVKSISNMAKNPDMKAKMDFAKVVSNLERSLRNSPSHERPVQSADENIIAKQFEDNMNVGINNVPVINEEEIITNTMKTSPKLRTFDNSDSLDRTRRKAVLKKHSSDIIRSSNVESKHVNLDGSSLYTASRKFSGANMNSADLLSKSALGESISIPNVPTSQIKGKSSYSMATVEEFFDVKNQGFATAPEALSEKVANKLGTSSHHKIAQKTANVLRQEEMYETKNLNTNISEPILTHDGVVVSGYKINDNSGFYIISDETGKSSLVGVVNNHKTILKEFATSVKYKLQVRKDSENVYIVRVGGERFLVEINGEKMGVLIEL